MVRSITTGVAEHETTILVLRHERASGTRTSSVSRLFDGRVRVDILLGSLAAVFRQMLSIFRLETLFRSFSDEFDELIRRRRFHDEVRKLAVPSLLEARFRLSLDEKLAKLLLLRKRGIHHDPIDRACRRLFRLRFGRGAFSRLQLSAHGIARCLELSAFRIPTSLGFLADGIRQAGLQRRDVFLGKPFQIGIASCRERVWQYVYILVVAVS